MTTGITTSIWLSVLDDHAKQNPNADARFLAELLVTFIRKVEQNDIQGAFAFLDGQLSDLLQENPA